MHTGTRGKERNRASLRGTEECIEPIFHFISKVQIQTSTGENVHRHSRDNETEMKLREHDVFSCLD